MIRNINLRFAIKAAKMHRGEKESASDFFRYRNVKQISNNDFGNDEVR